MVRRLMFVAALLVSVVLLPGAASASANDDNGKHNLFVAHLTAAQEVQNPAVVSNATGHASFLITDNDTKIRFRISERGVARVTQSHIHVGARGTNGPVILFLFPVTPVGGSAQSRPHKGYTFRDSRDVSNRVHPFFCSFAVFDANC